MDESTKNRLVNEVAESVNGLQMDLTKLAQDVVLAVEKTKKDLVPLSGADKQIVAVAVLSGYIKLPFPLSLAQNMILKLVVKRAVAVLNEVRGHDWTQAHP